MKRIASAAGIMPMMRPPVPTATSGQCSVPPIALGDERLSSIAVNNIGPGKKIGFINSRTGATTAARPKPIEP